MEKTIKGLQSFGKLLGRIALSAVFILAAVGKILDWDGTAHYMAAKGMTMIPLFLILAIIVELLGGLALLVGFRTRIAAAILLLFLIPVTGIFHDFWNAEEAQKQIQTIMFLKNLAIFGGLLYVVSSGPGGCSVDACRCKADHVPKKL